MKIVYDDLSYIDDENAATIQEAVNFMLKKVKEGKASFSYSETTVNTELLIGDKSFLAIKLIDGEYFLHAGLYNDYYDHDVLRALYRKRISKSEYEELTGKDHVYRQLVNSLYEDAKRIK